MTPIPITIRPETLDDLEPIQALYRKWVPQGPEGEIVLKLRRNCPEYLGWVACTAEKNSSIVGHVLLTPAELRPSDHSHIIVGVSLAPLLVHPDWRRQGIGSNLVHQALNAAQFMHKMFVVVMGWPDYYHRFGFATASTWGLHCEYADVPDHGFMVNILDADGLGGKTGKVFHRPEFVDAVHRAGAS